MKIDEIRRANLRLLTTEAGSAKKLADITGVSRSYLSQIKNKTIDRKTGRARSMGSEVARQLEKGMNKNDGWADQEHQSPSHSINDSAAKYELSNKAKQIYFDFEQLPANDKAKLFSILSEKAFSE